MKLLYSILFMIAFCSGISRAQTMITVTNTTSMMNCDGAAYFNTSSSYSPAIYTWSWYQDSTLINTGDTSITNLCSGNYQFVLDSAGMVVYSTWFTIGNPCSGFYISTSSTNTDPNACTGSITITPMGGTAPYTYQWSNGTTTQNIYGLCIGTYMITCVDANGCSATGTAIVNDGDSTGLLTSYIYTYDDYNAQCLGSAYAYPQGGIAPYTITWSNGDSGETADSLCAGIYSVTIWDANNDTITNTFAIVDPSTTYGNNPFLDSMAVDSLYGYLVENCTIDYNNIDSASLANAVYDSVNQNLYVTWAVYNPNGAVTYINDTLGISGQPGVYFLTITVYCPVKSGEQYFGIIGAIYLNSDGSLSVKDNELDWSMPYPNPFKDNISLSNESGAECTITLTDASGRYISTTRTSSTQIELGNLGILTSGTYFLHVSTITGSKTWKLVK